MDKEYIEEEFIRTINTLDRKTLIEMITSYLTIEEKEDWITQWKIVE